MHRMILMSAFALALGFAQPVSANCGIGWGQEGQGEGCSDRSDDGGSRELPAHDLGWATLAALMLAGGVFAAKGSLKPRTKL